MAATKVSYIKSSKSEQWKNTIYSSGIASHQSAGAVLDIADTAIGFNTLKKIASEMGIEYRDMRFDVLKATVVDNFLRRVVDYNDKNKIHNFYTKEHLGNAIKKINWFIIMQLKDLIINSHYAEAKPLDD